jgi:chromosome partitioning protein
VAVVTSIINLKGGVGKTTLTIALAHYLAAEHHRRVLVVDLDPQTNATVCLIPEHDWQARDRRFQTLYGLFLDVLEGTRRFDADAAIVANTSNVGGGVFGLDLLPSSIRLIGLQEDLARMVWPGVALNPPVMALRDQLAGVLDRYDHVLLDCPPALGVITQSGLLMSHLVLVPVVPDILSVQGVLPVLRLVEAFGRRSGHAVDPVGTVISRYDRHNRLHLRILDELRRGARAGVYPPIFRSLVPDAARIAAADDVYASPRTLRQKYGAAHGTFAALAREFMVRAERVSGVARIAAVDRDVRRDFTERRVRASAGPDLVAGAVLDAEIAGKSIASVSQPRGTVFRPAKSAEAWPRVGDEAGTGFGRAAAATRPMVAPDGTPLVAPLAEWQADDAGAPNGAGVAGEESAPEESEAEESLAANGGVTPPSGGEGVRSEVDVALAGVPGAPVARMARGHGDDAAGTAHG